MADKSEQSPEGSSCPVSPGWRSAVMGAGRDHKKPDSATETGACASGALDEVQKDNMMPSAARLGQAWMYAEQQRPLSTRRVESTIARGTSAPQHQPEKNEKWVYPSEQMFYNAMKRKGYDPKEDDMRTVVAIHNTVNEQTWNEVLKWERLHAGEDDANANLRLARFCGRPTDFSPQARLNMMLGYKAPFDRHDWYVDRGDGEQVRYIIDFYQSKPAKNDPRPVGFHLDVRPALDSPQAVWDRVRMAVGSFWS